MLRQEVVWKHDVTPTRDPTLFRPVDDRIYWLTKGRPALPEDGIGMDSVWEFDGTRPRTTNPSPFPREVPERCLRAVGTDGDVVLDPMGGSMTTCRAAADLGYRSIGVDVDPDDALDTRTTERRPTPNT